MHEHLLSTIIFLPLLGALIIFLFGKNNDESGKNSFYVAIWWSVVTFALSLLLVFKFNISYDGFQFEEKYAWLKDGSIGYHVGVDGISIWFIILTTFLSPLCILAGRSLKFRIKEFVIYFLILESLVIGVFAALDSILFYFFFEASLIPMFLIIGIWGGDNRIYASFKFFLYTLLGSLLFLIAIIYLYNHFGTSNIVELIEKAPNLSLEIQKYLWLALFASFAVKIPMWPVHTWLPDAHVQAPTSGSMILAGVLLKLGGYGFIRFSLSMFPDASLYFTDLVYILSVIAVIYTSLVAFAQKDMKKLIAYSSIAHMGFVTAGLFAGNQQAIEGAIFQMISHGIISAGLFFCVGVLYDRMHTKKISEFGGVTNHMPQFAFLFLTLTMASIGLPATSGFIGEFMIMLGVFQDSTIVGTLIATAMVLGAVYMLNLFRNVMYGKVVNSAVSELKELNIYERLILTLLVFFTILLGIKSNIILDFLHISVNNIL